MERLDRGVVAVALPAGGVFVSWRLLAADAGDVAFDVLRNGVQVNDAPLKEATSFVDRAGTVASLYQVRPRMGKGPGEPGAKTSVWAQAYLDIPITPPEAALLPDGQRPGYAAGDGAVGDLDGDGAYELVLKWGGREQDNSRRGYTSPVVVEALELDGTSLWRVNLGVNIRAGAHYTQVIVFDLDQDGCAEMACRTSDGAVDGTGRIIGEAGADYRDQNGCVLEGPEYLSIFDGRTGALRANVPFAPARGDMRVWGDDYGNRSERFLACVAYLDGTLPSLIMARGYYKGRDGIGPGRTALVAWDWHGGELRQRWVFDTLGFEEYSGYIGQGSHSIAAGDVDGDGRDEILYGAMAVDDDGTGLYTSGLGHGDAHHLGDLDPARPGLEFFMPHENAAPGKAPGMSFRDAGTGEVLWGIPVERPRDVGRGACENIHAASPGAESWGVDGMLYGCHGEPIGPAPRTAANFFVWWDGDFVREILNENWIAKYDSNVERGLRRLLTADGCTAINGSKATPVLSADLVGDWREEVIWRREDGRALRLYTTTIPTAHRVVTLMQDPIYRLSVAWQNVAYNQPPHLGFYLGAH